LDDAFFQLHIAGIEGLSRFELESFKQGGKEQQQESENDQPEIILTEDWNADLVGENSQQAEK
jgi:hypothetical protein